MGESGEICQFLRDNTFYHLFGIAESKLGPVVEDYLVQIDGYTLVRQDRKVGGGGVALYVRNTLKVKILEKSNTTKMDECEEPEPQPEYLMCSVQQGNSSPVFVAVVYRPPHVGLYANDLDEHLRTCGEEFSHKIVMGDFNADLIKPDAETRALLTFIDKHSLKVVRHGATHHTRTATTNSDTHIDLILIDSHDNILNFNKFPSPYEKNGHDIITATIELFVVEPDKKSFSYRDYRSIHPEALMASLAECDWTCFHQERFNQVEGLECLNTNLTTVIDRLAPLKVVRPMKGHDPWLDGGLINLRRKRDTALRRYLRARTNNPNSRLSKDLQKEFEALRNDFNARSTLARDAFTQTKISHALDTNKNGVWRELRNLGLLPQLREELHGIEPDALNSHFASVSTSDARVIDECNEVISQASEDGFRFSAVNAHDVVLAVAHFSTQARGSDGIPQLVIARALPFLAPYMVQVINASLTSGIFPEPWRESLLVALKKTATPSAPTDFRPIALLCFLSKVLEKIVHDQIHGYLVGKDILNSRQAGYKRHNSTETALLRLTEDIRRNIDKQKLTILLLFDFSKAFDTISPSRLLRKMRDMGFSRAVLCWISSYINGRKQKVVSKSEGESDWLHTNLGVPQGSVLGPLLFSLYINDLKHILKIDGDDDPRKDNADKLQHFFYADDLQIYLRTSIDQLGRGVAALTSVANGVYEWAGNAALKLNASKTKAIICGSSGFVDRIPHDLPRIEVSGIPIPYVDQVENLGVTIDSKFTWKPQVEKVVKRVNCAIYSLNFFRQFTTFELRKRLVSALALSHLDYCSTVYVNMSVDLKKKLQLAQNKCIRYVTGLRRDAHVTPARRQLGWLTTDMRRMYFSAIIIYKVRCFCQPKYLAELFKTRRRIDVGRGDAIAELDLYSSSSETGKRSLTYECALFYNELPNRIRNIPTLGGFKSALFKHLLNTDSQ